MNASSAVGHPQSGAMTRSKVTVCTSCRQSKVRCIGSQNSRCQRCLRLDLDCHIDPGYKRVSKSRKIADLEKQVQLLASAVNTGGRSASTPTSSSTTSETQAPRTVYNTFQGPSQAVEKTWYPSQSTLIGASSHNTLYSPPDAQSNFNGTISTDSSGSGTLRPPATMPRTIETLRLSPSQITVLFQNFFEHYHPFLPFLDPSKSPDDYYKFGPSLFWAIVGVGSRRYNEDVTLLTVLSEWVMKILWAEVAKPPYKLPTIQAIVVLCLWPFRSTTWDDVSVTLSSIAVSVSMQVGLHRPLNTQDFSRNRQQLNEMDMGILTKTWAVANIASQSSSAVCGQLPTAPFDWTIDRACEVENVYTLPKALRFKLMISRYCHRITKAMCSISYDSINAQSPPPGEPSSFMVSWQNDMAVFESDLENLNEENGSQFSDLDRLYLAAARLYVLSFYFFDSSATQSRKAGVLKAYNSAVAFISAVRSLDVSSGILLYLPYYLFRSLLTATCILIKVLKSSYAQDVGDFEAGKRAFNDSILAVARSSISNNDTGGKAVRLLSQVWHSSFSLSQSQSPPELAIKSRFGASITYDFLWGWRQEFGGLTKGTTAAGTTAEFLPTSDLPVPPFPAFFQDSATFNLDFLDDPAWNLGLGEIPMFGDLGR